MTDREKTEVPLAREVLDEHEGIARLVADLERCLDRPARDAAVWLADLREMLSRLGQTMRRHFETEEAGPLFRDLPVKHPRLAEPLARLEAEHPRMLEDLEAALRRLDALEDPEDYEIREMNARAQLIVARVRRHEAAENELVFEAHWSEIGVGD